MVGDDFDMIGRYMPERSRPTTEPGGCECMNCGCVFIGAPDDGLCLVCYEEWAAGRPLPAPAPEQTTEDRNG